MRKIVVVLFTFLCGCFFIQAQDITTHSYRKVAPENMEEYLDKEVNYWSKFAKSELKKGNLKYWAVLQRVGGEDQLNEPNILLITQINDIDKPVEWKEIEKMFPKKNLDDLMMKDKFKITDEIFLRDLGNDITAPKVNPEKDFKYVRINYHNMKDVWWHINFETQKVKPFFEQAMKDEKTSIVGWGNSLILTPKSDNFKFKTESHDYFKTFRDALGPNDFPDMDFPEGFFEEWQENYVGERNVRIYKVITYVKAKE